MTVSIGIVLAILVVSLVLFVTEWLRMDVVALLVLGSLALSGLVTPSEALSGFSNPAVVTVWAMFMLSAALTQTGVAGIIGNQVLRLAGQSEVRTIIVIMLTAGVLSAFMNNIGVAALMLPVVMDVARQLKQAPSRLLMPLAYGSLLGGLTTLIGTPPNLLVSDALRENGYEPYSLFDFTPVGGVAMIAGVLFVALVGRHLLPQRDISRESMGPETGDLAQAYELYEQTALMALDEKSPLGGRSLRDCRLGAATGLNVVAVIRRGRTLPAPEPTFVLEPGDRLVASGRQDGLNELRGWRELIIEEQNLELEALESETVGLADLRLRPESELVGKTLAEADFRSTFGLTVLAARRGASAQSGDLTGEPLGAGDRLLVQGPRAALEALDQSPDFDPPVAAEPGEVDTFGLADRLFGVRVATDSVLVGRTLADSRLRGTLGLLVMGIERAADTVMAPPPETRLEAGDRLIVRGSRDDIEVLRGLQELGIEERSQMHELSLESEGISLVEAILAPRSRAAGRTLENLDFRHRYGLRVLAILREGEAHRSGLRDMALKMGDALLLLGSQEKVALLRSEPDFVVLDRESTPSASTGRTALAAGIMIVVMTPVIAGWIPISIAAVVGATLMVMTRCLDMEDAYRAVEWRAIFLIAGMLPLGTAMQQTGAAELIAEKVVTLVSPFGAHGVVLGLYAVTAVATMIVPTAALIVLMAPIAIKVSLDMGLSIQAVMMAVAMAASASFTSPISHPANLLVMGPGGYRFSDYLKVGVPLTLILAVVVILVLPVFWPLQATG